MLFRHRRPPRRAVITGASSGIGRAFARELAAQAQGQRMRSGGSISTV